MTKIFTEDAKYRYKNGLEHFKKRKRLNEIPKDMGLSKYLKISEQVSLKSINGKSVRAYKTKEGMIVKNDGNWTVVYSGGKNGTLISSYPQSRSKFERKMKEQGEEIFKE